MDVRIESTGSTATAHLAGELDAHTCGALAEQVAELMSNGTPDLIVDVSALTFMDSSGLRVLVRARQEAVEKGGQLRLRGTTDAIERVLQITGLADTFDRA